MKTPEITFFIPEAKVQMFLDYASNPVHAGFPSPADDFLDNKLDLNRALVKNPSSTFYARVSGESMVDDGVDDGDILIVDKSVSFYEGCLAVCVIDSEFTLKRVKIEKDGISLIPANKNFKAIKIKEGNDFRIWGVVRYIIKKV
ncbi:MAG: translesion error-prone DNA polymerase V autoproteolytic subunit [Bacteroidales bacterium]|nr:translesion error-prone DNA polymerase V autoproteolytic subunit [Bacteroidales bacterium]MDD2424493.1 translesion error-prone DNA polymerase V autoproteolytic subunit [Bacteroidales bacterium]MDD3988525.1 translesion error-prone DNA polymerase V autoproteolytic subunit [Bacteroidales bacterium]MDD4638212.1 translesion error-prone DNA polymerase V autoproteolytic subunit [Bacteroidales bacterium]